MNAPTPDIGLASGDGVSRASSGRLRALWNAVIAGIAVVMGILPHVLHHIGLLAGTALIAGAGGTALFAVLGLAASVPFLVKLYRRFGTWLAPAVALAVFTVMFAVSAFIIGPAINGADGTAPAPAPNPATATATATSVDHGSHHP
jgi:Mn2+/Fe2+ NRAMP family transporter